MSLEIGFLCKIKSGKLSMSRGEKSDLLKYCQNRLDGTYRMTIKRYYAKRSGKQRRWEWGPIYKQLLEEIEEFSGYSKAELHEILLDKFCTEIKYIEKNGMVDEIRVTKRTSDMTTQEMTRYIEDVRNWAAIFAGVVIPDPDPSKRDPRYDYD